MTNPLDFSGKVALVTGAASGMGLATAQAFAEGRRGRRSGGLQGGRRESGGAEVRRRRSQGTRRPL